MPAKDKDFENQRALKRHYLIYYLRVFDRQTGAVLGHLVDVTPKGVMIMRDSPLEVGRAYSMRIRWRDSAGRLRVVDFEGVCRWCRRDVNPDFYGAGLVIETPAAEGMESMMQLIGDLGMP